MLNKSKRTLCARQLTQDDLLTDKQYKTIAELIFETDSYIYPALFAGSASPQKTAEQVLSYVLKHEHDAMFSKNNLFVCLDGSEVLGIILWKRGNLDWDYDGFMLLAERAGNTLIYDNVKAVGKRYFEDKYINESTAAGGNLSIINVCVRKAARGLGVGDFMLKKFIETHESESMELCVLCDNDHAISLYKKYGFEISSQFKGFSLDGANKPTCYGMKRLGKG